MKHFFKEKFFTILLSTVYIFAIISNFYNFEILACSLVFIFLSALILFRNFSFRKSLILFLIFFIGIFRADLSDKTFNPIKDLNINNAEITGQIISSENVSLKNKKEKFYLNSNEIKIYDKTYKNLNLKTLVTVDLDSNLDNKIKIGNYVSVKGKIRSPIESKNPYQFDYKKYLKNNNCETVFYGESSSVKFIKTPVFNKNFNDSWYFILQKFDIARRNILKTHSKNIKSPNLEVLGSIVFGNETINVDESISEQFKNSGLLHLLAASGLNVALIFGIWWWLASLIKFPYNLSIFIGAIFVVLYTFMTGFPPSILRAGIMLLFVLFGKIIDRKASSIGLIFFVGFLILLFNPKMIFDIGFQLSFMVTIGLITCCPVIISKFDKLEGKFKEKYENLSKFKKYFVYLFSPKNLISICLIPLIAQIWVIPLQMHYFYNLSLLSIFANICVVPFIGILSFIGFLSSIFALIPVLSDKIVYLFDLVANPLLNLLVKISEIFSSAKYSLISTIGLNTFQIFVYWFIVLLFVLCIKYNFKNKKYLIQLIVLGLVFGFSFIDFDFKNNDFKIIAFDVQNADAFLIKSPKNKYILIDTGKKTYKGVNDAQIIIKPYLKNKRINNIDYLIITHFDSDHCGGTIDILKNFKVKEIIIQNNVSKTETSDEIFKYIKNNKIKYKIVKNNEIILKENNFSIKTYVTNLNNDNENSIATLINYYNNNILFLGDMSIVGFNKIRKFFPNNIDIIKIGHHGAKNTINKEIIDNFKIKYALISSKNHDINHPHYSIINLLKENNVKILTTKNLGFIEIIYHLHKINIYNYDVLKSKLLPINFEYPIIPFHKSNYAQDFIKDNS